MERPIETTYSSIFSLSKLLIRKLRPKREGDVPKFTQGARTQLDAHLVYVIDLNFLTCFVAKSQHNLSLVVSNSNPRQGI